MSSGNGPPKHQNSYAWKPNAGHKKNEKELGGKFRPYSEVTGVCQRCKDQIEWKRRYGKYKPLIEPRKCQQCGERAVRQAYHNLCSACAKERNVCAKCSSRVGSIIGRDVEDKAAERKTLDEAIRNARERDRRTLLRAMNKNKPVAKALTAIVSKQGAQSSITDEEEDNDDEIEAIEDDEDDGNDLGKPLPSAVEKLVIRSSAMDEHNDDEDGDCDCDIDEENNDEAEISEDDEDKLHD